ncbi:MAG: hypothetical protein M1503_10995, partial [Thaumarchaeota archaeon]|nr:hypothetical protein [Nitrososphaerota archaeon]
MGHVVLLEDKHKGITLVMRNDCRVFAVIDHKRRQRKEISPEKMIDLINGAPDIASIPHIDKF